MACHKTLKNPGHSLVLPFSIKIQNFDVLIALKIITSLHFSRFKSYRCIRDPGLESSKRLAKDKILIIMHNSLMERGKYDTLIRFGVGNYKDNNDALIKISSFLQKILNMNIMQLERDISNKTISLVIFKLGALCQASFQENNIYLITQVDCLPKTSTIYSPLYIIIYQFVSLKPHTFLQYDSETKQKIERLFCYAY